MVLIQADGEARLLETAPDTRSCLCVASGATPSWAAAVTATGSTSTRPRDLCQWSQLNRSCRCETGSRSRCMRRMQVWAAQLR